MGLISGYTIPARKFLIQKVMLRVCYGLTPLVLASVYLFGWRALALLAVVLACGVAAEALFAFRNGQPVTSAVLVTGLIFFLSLPPTIPFWMAAVGIVAGVCFGKMVFGGFGMNTFNPAMVGRCFIYVTFPIQMTGQWAAPAAGPLGGLAAWTVSVDAVTQATPLVALKHGGAVPWLDLFLGNVSGSLGETSALLIILSGLYLVYTKAASWRLAGSFLLGGLIVSGLHQALGSSATLAPIPTLLSGSFLFGCAFVITEPITGPKTQPAQWFYGLTAGALVVVLRAYSNFAEGVMFAVLLVNSFAPLMDHAVRAWQARKGAAR